MSTEATILAALKTALEGITKANSYNTNVRLVKHQASTLQNVENRPAVTFFVTRRERENASFGRSNGMFEITIRGWIDIQEENYTPAWNFQEDIESLLNTWTYEEWTNIRETIPYYDSSISEMIAVFDVNISVDYYYTEGSP